ncbi:diguanylate cyclase [[Leptolyngbya] sp. PCC 7376]|uniref:diguanylate cyclase domain-containing protein n=1 Tax=[Leptolyngbya] sp. PCC 7376 TaxID=111781 RepID=UPI00029EF36C|nr:diguanylate cyclase [[Leptolyngbya] sp. PCC 7376]AFY39642.1 diguanylate cyclase [[Leptolyngbya] sp. PCC 7376]
MGRLSRHLKKISRQLFRLLNRYIILILIGLLALGLSFAYIGTYRLSANLIDSQAMHYAQVAVKTLNEARQLYSSNVVGRVKDLDNVTVDAKYHEIEGGIPNPATFTIELGQLLSDEMPGMLFRLYSDYPFPNREATGGPRDQFEKDALVYLRQHPGDSFYRKDQVGNHVSFRYAEAVVMEPSCVACHNSLDISPKKDWKVGDVRGVVEITQPLDTIMLIAQDGLKTISFVLTIILSLAIAGIFIVISRLRSVNQDLEDKVAQRTQELQELATTDCLTTLANRRHFETVFREELRRATRAKHHISLIMCDVDHFKKYNDTYGHQAGDDCLYAVAQVFKSYTQRAGDLAARCGGEEFIILLPNINAEQVTKIASLIQESISNLNLEHRASTTAPYVTLSLGLTTVIPTEVTLPEELIKMADKALYQAKENGRNRFMFLSLDT